MGIDLALICAPPSGYEAYIQRALLRDAHVYCEKRVFPDPGNGVKLVALARQRRGIIHPGHNYVHSPRLTELGRGRRPSRRGDQSSSKPISAFHALSASLYSASAVATTMSGSPGAARPKVWSSQATYAS